MFIFIFQTIWLFIDDLAGKGLDLIIIGKFLFYLLPNLSEKVHRPDRVKVVAQDLEGQQQEFESEGFEARAICHEVDHLDGVLFIDLVRGLRRDRLRRRMKKLNLKLER